MFNFRFKSKYIFLVSVGASLVCLMFYTQQAVLATKNFQLQNSSFDHQEKFLAPDNIEENDKNNHIPTWSAINAKFPKVKRGGRFTPERMSNSQRIVILVPYRDRRVMLKIFLNYMHTFLQRQNANYVIYVVEMEPEGLFRKTVLINAGFLEVMKRENTSCLIIHDVDMFPMDDTNIYRCGASVRRLLSARHPAEVANLTVSPISKQYDWVGPAYFGGIVSFPTHYFRMVNGYSNLYSGWGREDTDVYERIKFKKIPIDRETSRKGRYYVLSHVRQPEFVNGIELVKAAAKRMDRDGLNSVRYELKTIEERVLFTWILIKTKTPSFVLPDFVEKHVNQTLKGYTFIKSLK